jgi:hypothetical protein
MREHFNRVNNLPQGYFYESEEETEYASTWESITATCTYCIKNTKFRNIINTNITKKYKNNINIKKMTYDNIFVIEDHKHEQ